MSRRPLSAPAALLRSAGLAAGGAAQPRQDVVTRAANQWLAAARTKDAAAPCRLRAPAADEPHDCDVAG